MSIKEALEKSFNDLLPLSLLYKSELKEHEKTFSLIEDAIGGFAGKKVLDIGCGLGISLRALSLLGAVPEGVDKHVLNERKDLGGAEIEKMWREKGIKVLVDDFSNALYPENVFDAVIAENVFEHLPFIQKEFLEKIYKILAPAGHLVLATPNLANITKRLRMADGKSPYWDLNDFFFNKQPFGHIREFTGEELRFMAEACGFKVERVAWFNIYFGRHWLKNTQKWPWVAGWLASSLFPSLRDKVFLVAKKSN